MVSYFIPLYSRGYDNKFSCLNCVLRGKPHLIAFDGVKNFYMNFFVLYLNRAIVWLHWPATKHGAFSMISLCSIHVHFGRHPWNNSAGILCCMVVFLGEWNNCGHNAMTMSLLCSRESLARYTHGFEMSWANNMVVAVLCKGRRGSNFK